MASSGSVFSETLQEITNTKLEELSKRREAFENEKYALLSSVKDERDPLKSLGLLTTGVKRCLGVKSNKDGKVIVGHGKSRRLEVELSHLDRFLAQTSTDPSISQKMLHLWKQSLLHHLDTQSLKFQYADLYGKLVTEWLSGGTAEGIAEDADMGEGFEDVGNAKRLEARMEWEKMVFEPAKVDTQALKRYLDDLFGTKDGAKKDVFKAIEKLREAVADFEGSLSQPDQFSPASLAWVIQGLLASDLLSDEKREVLKDFKGNQIILSEIADVLNMRLSALTSWSWGVGVPVEQRRKISGIYSVHMHEDLLQAIFLQYIGSKWSVFFKQAFTKFRKSKLAWQPLLQEVPLTDRKRLGYYLGPLKSSTCLQIMRSTVWSKDYFMSQLLDSVAQQVENLEGEEVADYEQFTAVSAKRRAAPMQMQMQSVLVAQHPSAPTRAMPKMSKRGAMRSRAVQIESDEDESYDDGYTDGDDTPDSGPKNPMQIKQRLLHLLATEIAINTRLHGEITAFHSSFENWNSLLPHDTVKSVLSFLGVSETWLGFFAKFLSAPLKFLDDESSVPRTRRRGTPASHVLSDVFGETVLFCLDFAVNQSTNGRLLHRLYDDFWFWSPEHSISVQAWRTVQAFTAATSTSLNTAKSGTIRVARGSNVSLPIDKSLPSGEIRWGFLRLSGQTGLFEIDQKMVDAHIDELRKQLQDKRNTSIFAFVRAWNTYASTFFTSNFGKPANCFGRDHVDQMLATHERIQRQIFSSTNGSSATSVVAHLKKLIHQRFGIADVPDGYIFFPTELGGLDLNSPFISLLQIRDSVLSSTDKLFIRLDESEQDAYKRALTAFLKGETAQQRYLLEDPSWVPADVDRHTFLSFDEFVRYRERFDFAHATQVHNVFKTLMENPQEEPVEPDGGALAAALSALGSYAQRGITSNWLQMDSYWRWVAMLYGPEIVDRFGGMSIVDPGLLPMGMVALLKDKRVTWQG